jgi:4,5-dihydroxyphthalate decarboxylase
MLPWLQDHMREIHDVLGEGYWDYGLERNRRTLETFARYSHEQGLAASIYRLDEMFVPSASDGFAL